jgi:predicted ester cyclase
MGIKGFDEKFVDLPDYILRITKEIWEDRGIDTLNHYYAPDIAVRSPSGIVMGNQSVIGATMATLAEFPDRQLLGEDVIWSGNEDDGFLSSHRIMSTATHLGDGSYGPASGKKLRYRVIADCAAKDNQIYDEWLIRDQGAIVRQLGTEPNAFAANQIAEEGGPELASRPFTANHDKGQQYLGSGNDNEFGATYADILRRMMEGGMDAIPQTYDRAANLEYPSGVTGVGWNDADQFWMGLRSSFPDAELEIHHQIGREDPAMAPRAALRWSLHGSHDGNGTFGAPTGADVYIMGMSHAEFGPYGLRREWVLLDETAVYKQILLHTG